MLTCENCIHSSVCTPYNTPNDDYPNLGDCPHFKDKADYVEVVRCRDCVRAIELDKHCEMNRDYYKSCSLLRGEETDLVWHKYKKYYRSYSIVEPDDFCNYGKRKESEVRE